MYGHQSGNKYSGCTDSNNFHIKEANSINRCSINQSTLWKWTMWKKLLSRLSIHLGVENRQPA